jgi:coniferyl-aldehyde dehydrogenase
MGNYHGYDGFKTFSHARSVFEQGFFDLGLFTRPPYTEWLEKVVHFMMKL